MLKILQARLQQYVDHELPDGLNRLEFEQTLGDSEEQGSLAC